MAEHNNEKSSSEQTVPINQRVSDALEELKPWLQADGGDVELVEVTDEGLVKVRLMGACGGCPMREMTLKSGIGRVLKQKVPEVTDVIAV
jgi:Fe-S cluster biogenesis protein NfuA